MLATLSLALLMSVAAVDTKVDAEAVARAFTTALVQNDLAAVSGGGPQASPFGTARDTLQIHEDVTLDSYRVASVESGPESTFILVEIDGSATATGTRNRVPWPRWWSLEVKNGELVSSMVLERRLAYDLMLAGPDKLSAALVAHPEIDLDRFMLNLANAAADAGPPGCETLLWMLRETEKRGLIGSHCTTLQMLSYLGATAGNIADAIPPAERSLKLAQATGVPDYLADSYFSVGIAYWLAGRLEEAAVALGRSAAFFGQTDDPRLPMRSAYMGGYVEMSRDRLREALAFAESHSKMLEACPSPRGSLDNAFQLGSIQERLGNVEIAHHHFDTARTVARDQLHDQNAEVMATYNVAELEYRLNRPGARALLEKAYAMGGTVLAPEYFTTVQRKLASVRSEEGDFPGAEQLFAEIQPVADKATDPNVTAAFYSTRSLSRLDQGRVEEALADSRKARSYTTANNTSQAGGEPRIEALTAEGLALRALSRPDEAEASLRAAIDVTELELTERSGGDGGLSAVRWLLTPYRVLLDLLASQGCAREALVVAERMRARSLRESLQHGRIDLSSGLNEAKRARERELETAVATANRALLGAADAESMARFRRERDEARLGLQQFRSELYIAHPDLDRRRADRSERNDEWQPLAAPGEVVLELAVNDDAVFAFVISGTGVAVHRIAVTREVLEQKVGAFVTALEQRDLTYRQPARALYDLLLGPLGPQLASAERIRIVPDGALWRVPFHALIDGKGRHLAERVPVAYSPSLAPTRGAAPRNDAPRTLYALADPAIDTAAADTTRSFYRDVTLGRLPDAAAEATAIARLYAGSEVRLGAEAQESVFKDEAPGFRILHLATHSIVDDGAPMFSSIVLAASNANPLDDGLLEAREIADLDLHAELAVLSACETARGAITPGEGVVGLSWAFLAAGVPTTVVSQWKVGSASTADLMVRFHRHLRGGAPASAALRAAMLDLRRDPRWRHPFYWAPFVVIENSGLSPERQ